MKMKKYEVSDMKEALKLIKQDLGPDAVILSTRKVMKSNNFGLFARPVLEVTAAVDYKAPQKQQTPKRRPHASVPAFGEDNAYASRHPSSYTPKTRADRVPAVKNAGPVQEKTPTFPYADTSALGGTPRYGYGAYEADSFEEEEKEYVELAPMPVRSSGRYEAPETADAPYAAYVPPEPKADDGMEKVAAVISSLGLDKFSGLLSDIGDIKRQLSEMKSGMTDNMVIDLPPRLKDFHTLFIKNGVDDILSYRFLKNLEKRVSGNLTNAQIRSAAVDMLSDLILTEPDYCSAMTKRIIAFAGPTGVGKTTTIAKIAANMALKYDKKVCLITVDNFRIGAVEQLKTYAEIVNLPLYVATSPEELKRIIMEVRNRYDCVLLDSMGRSQFDAGQIKSMGDFFRVDDSISVALVLSLASNHSELCDTLERYAALSPEYLIFTKLDETRYFGPLINLPVKKKIPLLLVTTGQNVPDDMESPDGKKIAKRVLQEIPTLWSEK